MHGYIALCIVHLMEGRPADLSKILLVLLTSVCRLLSSVCTMLCEVQPSSQGDLRHSYSSLACDLACVQASDHCEATQESLQPKIAQAPFMYQSASP